MEMKKIWSDLGERWRVLLSVMLKGDFRMRVGDYGIEVISLDRMDLEILG